MNRKSLLLKSAFAFAAVGAAALFVSRLAANDGPNFDHFLFMPNTLVLSRSVYVGNASTITVGGTLPPGCVPGTFTIPLLAGGTTTVAIPANSNSGCNTAIADGTFPTLFNNDTADGSFGITSPIFLDDLTTDGFLLDTLPIPSNLIVTSFSSKSELAIHRSTDGRSLTFLGYRGGPGFPTAANVLDVSNSNTPGVIDPSNPAVSQNYRSVAEVDAFAHIMVTDSNAYSGDNGRGVIKGDSLYYMVGNDNNGSLTRSQLSKTQIGVDLVTSTGVELLVPGQAPPVPPNITMIGTFSVTSLGYPADKPGKDTNFRGITIFNNTLYVTKGSGGNGINTVYQVGTPGVLPSGDAATLATVPITIPPGFPTNLASSTTTVYFPFGIWFANANTLYVCDEGDGNLISPPVNGNVASAYSQANSGIQKWMNVNGSWQLAYVLNNGLNIGIPYAVPNYPSALNPATDGCRNLTGRVHRDGTVTLYAVTSTVSPSGDQGADPNKLVKVTDLLGATTLPSTGWDPDRVPLGQFITIRSARSGEVYRGIDWAPTTYGWDSDD